MSVTISTAGSDYDASVKVFTGARGALTRVTSSPEFAFRALAHTTYYFMIHDSSGLDGIGGTLVFALHEIPALHITPTIRGTGSFDPQTGVAKISGTVDCSAAAAVSFFGGVLRRSIGPFVISGSIPDFTLGDCSGAMQWTATVTPINGKFRGGPATATLSWSAYDLGGTGQYVTGTATAKIHLKGGH